MLLRPSALRQPIKTSFLLLASLLLRGGVLPCHCCQRGANKIVQMRSRRKTSHVHLVNLCALLADLKTADREFARGLWYGILLNIGTFRDKERVLTRFSSCCIGVCVGEEPNVRCLLRYRSTRGLIELSQAIITIPGTTTTTPIPTLSQTSSGSMTYIQRHSSASLSPFSSWSLTYIQRHSSDSLEPTPSISTSSTSSSPFATCSSVVGSTSGESVTYNEYYSGTGYVENTNSPGNQAYLPIYSYAVSPHMPTPKPNPRSHQTSLSQEGAKKLFAALESKSCLLQQPP